MAALTKGDKAHLIRGLLRRLEAKDKLLAAYRLQQRPSEKTFRDLEETAIVEFEARAWLEMETP